MANRVSPFVSMKRSVRGAAAAHRIDDNDEGARHLLRQRLRWVCFQIVGFHVEGGGEQRSRIV